jgi:hypothetical protein
LPINVTRNMTLSSVALLDWRRGPTPLSSA